MPGHLLGLSATYGVEQLQNLSAAAMLQTLTIENVCNYFTLAHRHGLEALAHACVKLVDKDLKEVLESDGFQHLSQELLVAMIRQMANTRQSKQKRSCKRKRKRKRSDT